MKGIKLIRRKPYVMQKDCVVTVPYKFRGIDVIGEGDELYAYITRDGDLLLSVTNYQAEATDDH